MTLEVYKFGGVAMGTPEAIRAAVARVAAARRDGRQVACVASAMQGITDLLLAAGRAALGGEAAAWEDAAVRFEARHSEVVTALLADPARAAAAAAEIAAATHELRAMC